MLSLLEVVITTGAVMLMLALAAERLQEIVKATFALKSATRLAAVRRLVIEAARSQGLLQTGGQEIFEQVMERLRNLGQNGLRKKAVRLDSIEKEQLAGLITRVNAAEVSGLGGVGTPGAQPTLLAIAQQAEQWFDLAMEPVGNRHRRRMQLWAVAAAAVVVGALNANVITIVQRALTDPAFREVAADQALRLRTADSVAQALRDSVAAAPADTSAAAVAARARLAAQRDTAVARLDSLLRVSLAGSTSLFGGYPKGWRFSGEWLLGMIASVLLVSLGAPFWHDVLESVFGLKSRLRLARPKAAADEGEPKGADRNKTR